MQDEQKTESIKNLINAIDKHDIYLPEFQRDFVWDLTRTYDLFDSLCSRYIYRSYYLW